MSDLARFRTDLSDLTTMTVDELQVLLVEIRGQIAEVSAAIDDRRSAA